MTAHGLYAILVGEIGISRREFLYDLKAWEIRSIMRGYDRRRRDNWASTRWQTFWLLHNGMVDWSKNGIRKPSDLMQFPWEDETPPDADISDEEIDDIRAAIQAENEKNGKPS